MKIKYEDIEVIKSSGMTFWKLKGDSSWSRNIIELKKLIDEIREEENENKKS